jgi:hypothetical protein
VGVGRGEAYFKSQAGLGWACLTDRYDDGEYPGGNTGWPAKTDSEKRAGLDVDPVVEVTT